MIFWLKQKEEKDQYRSSAEFGWFLHLRRARFHSSMLDSRMLNEGQEFKELKDSYVIFIYKHDKFRIVLLYMIQGINDGERDS